MRRVALWIVAVSVLLLVLLVLGFRVFGEGDVEPQPVGGAALFR